MNASLTANDDMRAVVDELIKDGRITRSLAEYARSQGYTDQDIIASRERVKVSQASVYMQGNPLLRRPQQGPVNPGDPTPERLSKGGKYMSSTIVGKGEAAPARRYRIKSMMDIHGDKFEIEHRLVFSAFVGDSELHKRIRVANLDSTGGGSGVKRLGGLGNVPEPIRDRHERYVWVTKQMCELEKEIADILATMAITKRDGTPFTAEEYGSMKFPMSRDRNLHRNTVVGMFMVFCDRLVWLYHHPQCPRVGSRLMMVE